MSDRCGWSNDHSFLEEREPPLALLFFLQICSWLPSSITRLVGSLKNSIALSELLSIQANSFSRHNAIPGCFFEATSFCRPRKKLVLIILNGSPQVWVRARSLGISTSSM